MNELDVVAQFCPRCGSPFRFDGAIRPFSASAGVTASRPGDTPESLRKRADSALYEAKRQGRGRYVIG